MSRIIAFFTHPAVIILGVVGLGIATGATFLWQNGTPNTELYTVRERTLVREARFSGSVEAASSSSLGFDTNGRVKTVTATEGAAVTRGALLAELENSEERAELAEARATQRQEELELETMTRGSRRETVSAQQAAVRSARSSVRETRDDFFTTIEDSYRVAANAVYNNADRFFENARTLPIFKVNISGTTKQKVEDQRQQLQYMLRRWNKERARYTLDGDIAAYASTTKRRLRQVQRFISEVTSQVLQDEETTDDEKTDIEGAWSDVNDQVKALNEAQEAFAQARETLSREREQLTIDRTGERTTTVAKQRAVIDAKQAAVKRARAALEKTIIRAPFSGVVTDVAIESGEAVQTNEPVITIQSPDRFEIEGDVSELDIARIDSGDTARLRFDALPETAATGTVTHIDPAETLIDGVPAYEVTIIPDQQLPELKAGMSVDITITTDRIENVLAIPAESLVSRSRGRGTVRLVTEDGQQTDRQVTLGESGQSGFLEVTDGLSVGDRIVKQP